MSSQENSDFWKDKITIPNFLTILRPISGFIFVTMLFLGYSKLVLFFIFFIGILTDFFDGFLARKLNQSSEFGKFLDPIADRVFFITTFLSIIVYVSINRDSGMLFSSFSKNALLIIFLLIPREILCSIGILISLLRKKKPYVLKILLGRLTGLFQYITICAIILDFKFSILLAMPAFIIGIIYGVLYIKGALK